MTKKEEQIRKRLHNTVMEMKGNIRVYCRIRPMLGRVKNERQSFTFDSNDIEHKTLTLSMPPSNHHWSGQFIDGKKYKFEFDRVFKGNECQSEIFTEISELVQSALDGYKVCIFAYGQTGAGKTHTMEGSSLNQSDTNRGIIPRAVEQIFKAKQKLSAQNWTFKCSVSHLEIYNEKIRDLLVPKNRNNFYNFGNEYLHIHQRQRGNINSSVSVEGLSRIEVFDPFEVYKLLALASSNRSVSRTECNERSSRSHSVFQLFLSGQNRANGQTRFGVLSLIDLAGSERLKKSNVSSASATQLKETQNINKSLSCLRAVIAALSMNAKGTKHIPYRNSKLTYLLMDCFGRDSAKTLMFVNLCPEQDKCSESLQSLRFADMANKCQIRNKRTLRRH